MEREDEEPRRSSLPSSLIPHLFSRPQPPRDSLTSVTGPLARSNSPEMNQTGRWTTEELSRSTSRISITPAVPLMAPGPPFNEGRGGPVFYSPHGQVDPDVRGRGSSMTGSGEFPVSEIRCAVDPSSMAPVGQRYGSPIYSDPSYHVSRSQAVYRGSGYTLPPREPTLRTTWREWREGEAGPSSLAGSVPAGLSRPPVGSNPSLRFTQQNLLTPAESMRQSVLPGMAVPAQRLYEPQTSQPFQELPPPHALFPGSEAQPSVIYGRRHESYPAVLNLTSAAAGRRPWPSGEIASNQLPVLPPIKASETAGPEPPRAGKVKDEGDDGSESTHGGRKHGRDSMDTEDGGRRVGSARKTAVACNFCRGRKLRCNGARPTCHNCTVRKLECEYVATQRRRGPGKANKGSRTKKRGQTQMSEGSIGGSSTGEPTTGSVKEYDLDTLAPELRPYTSVMSLDRFTFQLPERSPAYPGTVLGPEREGEGWQSGGGERSEDGEEA
ncbi:hypothetical protein AX17_006216 [Amanita inopinata Kibby_2008]|nr:hypothetical protein AX17_006216 [Amanita inopinata Kibby_2008]